MPTYFINLLIMTNLYDAEKHRLRVYGQMLKSDILDHQSKEKQRREEIRRRENIQLQKHIESTKLYNQSKVTELKELSKSLNQDNAMLSTFKKTMQNHVPYQEGQNFIEGIQEMDNKRIEKVKKQLQDQSFQNYHQLSTRRMIEEKIHEIDKKEEQRHQQRIKQMQLNSKRNYEEIKQKHQQNMNIFQMHKQLVKDNQHYRDQLEEFTNANHGLLDRFNRNEYLQRRYQQLQNQGEIKRQMEELQKRKNNEQFQYMKKIGDIEQSMMKNMLVKTPKYEPRSYSSELKAQMQKDNRKRMEERKAQKEKIEMDNFFGGVHGRQRQYMMKYVDKGLGISSYQANHKLNSSLNPSQIEHPISSTSQVLNQQNPQINNPHRKASTPRSHSRRSKEIKKERSLNYSKGENNEGAYSPIVYNYTENSSNREQRTYKSFDPISGNNRYYSYQ